MINDKVEKTQKKILSKKNKKDGSNYKRNWPSTKIKHSILTPIIRYYETKKVLGIELPKFLDKFYAKLKEREILYENNVSKESEQEEKSKEQGNWNQKNGNWKAKKREKRILFSYLSSPPDAELNLLTLMEHSPLLYYSILKFLYKNRGKEFDFPEEDKDLKMERAIVECCQLAISNVYERIQREKITKVVRWKGIIRAALENNQFPPQVVKRAESRMKEYLERKNLETSKTRVELE